MIACILNKNLFRSQCYFFRNTTELFFTVFLKFFSYDSFDLHNLNVEMVQNSNICQNIQKLPFKYFQSTLALIRDLTVGPVNCGMGRRLLDSNYDF